MPIASACQILVTFDESLVSDGLSSQDGFARTSHAEDSDPARVLLQPVEFLPDTVHKLWSADKHHGPLWHAAFAEHRLDCKRNRKGIDKLDRKTELSTVNMDKMTPQQPVNTFFKISQHTALKSHRKACSRQRSSCVHQVTRMVGHRGADWPNHHMSPSPGRCRRRCRHGCPSSAAAPAGLQPVPSWLAAQREREKNVTLYILHAAILIILI